MEILSLLLATYIISVGFGIMVKGQRGLKWVNRLWLRAITGTIGWMLDQIGNIFKAVGKKVRR